MKKIMLSLVLTLTSMVASAQVWLGGSLGVNIIDPVTYDKSGTITSITFSPEIGYSFNDKWAIGFAFNEVFMSQDGESANSFSFEPYGRFTFAQSGIASFFVEGGLGIGSTKMDSDGNILNKSCMEFYVGVRPGVKINLSEKVGLVAKLGFLGYEHVENYYDAFGLSVNNNTLSFGMYYNF